MDERAMSRVHEADDPVVDGARQVGGEMRQDEAIRERGDARYRRQGFRRRGLARGLMQGVLGDAYRRGARTATLQSTPMGVPLYRSLGFEPVGRYDEWVPA